MSKKPHSKTSKPQAKSKQIRFRLRHLYKTRPLAVIVSVVIVFVLLSGSAFAAYRVATSKPQTFATTDQTSKVQNDQKQAVDSTPEAQGSPETSPAAPPDAHKPGESPPSSSNPTSKSSPATSPGSSSTTPKPASTPSAPAIAPYYRVILPASVTKADHGATMTYTIAMTIIPNETFGKPMIRQTLFNPGVCINSAELIKTYRYSGNNTISMTCVIDKSQPAYGMTELNLDFSITQDNGKAIPGDASGWVHVLPSGYNQ